MYNSMVRHDERHRRRKPLKFWTSAVARGDKVLLRGVEDGIRIKREIKYEPVMYVPCRPDAATHRSIRDEPLAAVDFGTIGDAKEFLKSNEGRVHGFDKWAYQFLAREYPGRVDFDMSKILVGYIDIEVMSDDKFSTPEEASKEVTVITLMVGDRIVMLGCQPYQVTDDRVTYVLCADERELLTKFLAAWSSMCPDVISGWNIEGYDIPYLVNRIDRVLGKGESKKLSPWRTLSERRVSSMGKERTVYMPMGVSVLDYNRVFHKLGVMTRACDAPDDYKLNTVAAQELGEKKLDYSQYESLHDLYVRDWQTYCDYNLKDVLLVRQLNDKLQLIELICMMAYDCKVNFEDMLGSVRPWEAKIHHELLSDGIVMPPRESGGDNELIGAYVKDTPPSAYDWVVSFDVDGMYPAIISMMNISAETKVGRLSTSFEYDDRFVENVSSITHELRSRNLIIAANSVMYRGDVKGHIPRILETVAEKRNAAKAMYVKTEGEYERTKDPKLKDEMARWKNVDKGLKVLRNANYGVLTNKYFLFYDHDSAEAITTSGQVIIKHVTRRINDFLNKTLGTDEDFIVANDTDSVYVNMGPLVERVMAGRSHSEVCDFLDRVCKTKIQEIIDKSFEDLQVAVNAPVNYLKMKRESIASRGIWTGAKNYALNKLDNEGTRYAEPKIEIKGMAAVKSSTPPACREKIKDAVKLIMSGTEDDVDRFISDFRREFDTLPFHDIAFPRGVNDIEKWTDTVTVYRSGTPIQIRAAILYNRLIRQMGLNQYPEIYDGDKIKFAYLMTPNPITENVFGTPGPLVPGVVDYIDRDVMFDKGFLVPLKSILDAIGWRSGSQGGHTLDQFFG